KGFNQAVTAARLGARAALIGAAGDDEGLASFREAAVRDGVELRVAIDGAGTGLAFPMVLPDGGKSIVLLPCANEAHAVSHADAAADVLRGASALLLPQEVPVGASV